MTEYEFQPDPIGLRVRVPFLPAQGWCFGIRYEQVNGTCMVCTARKFCKKEKNEHSTRTRIAVTDPAYGTRKSDGDG